MTRKISGLVFLVLTLLMVSGCSTPHRPVIFEAENFDGKDIRKGITAFLLPPEVDLSAVVQDFVVAFEGDPAKGEKFILEHLGDSLSRDSNVWELNRGMTPRQGVRLTDLASVIGDVDIREMVTTDIDRFGISHVEATDPEQLDSMLEEAGFDNLLLCLNLQVTRQAGHRAIVGGPNVGREVFSDVGEASKFATLYGQIIIWDRSSQAFVWNGYISGNWVIMRNFTQDTVLGMVDAFAYDVSMVLR